jgi:hypothetical protein
MRLSLINILFLLSSVFVQLYAQTNGLHSEAPLNLLKNLSSKSSLTTEERNQALGAIFVHHEGFAHRFDYCRIGKQ